MTIRTFALSALAALSLSFDALAQSVDQPAPPAAVLGDIALLHPDVGAAATSAREAEARADAAANRARGAARNGERVRGNAVTNGNGYAETARGDVYAGGFSNGVFQGNGVYTFAEGSTLRYEGEFADGGMVGDGVYYWRNGNRFSGARTDQGRNGPGVFVFADGRRYEGGWINDVRSGAGVEWSADGRVRQAGIWADNVLATPLAR